MRAILCSVIFLFTFSLFSNDQFIWDGKYDVSLTERPHKNWPSQKEYRVQVRNRKTAKIIKSYRSSGFHPELNTIRTSKKTFLIFGIRTNEGSEFTIFFKKKNKIKHRTYHFYPDYKILDIDEDGYPEIIIEDHRFANFQLENGKCIISKNRESHPGEFYPRVIKLKGPKLVYETEGLEKFWKKAMKEFKTMIKHKKNVPLLAYIQYIYFSKRYLNKKESRLFKFIKKYDTTIGFKCYDENTEVTEKKMLVSEFLYRYIDDIMKVEAPMKQKKKKSTIKRMVYLSSSLYNKN